MHLARPALALFLPAILTSSSVSGTLETGTWHCPSHIHAYSNATSSTAGCNDTSTSVLKHKLAGDYKPACCDAVSFPANSYGEFGAANCYTAWRVAGRRRGQYTCFLDEVVNGVGLRTKQGNEACCYDVDGNEREYICVGVVY